jgi:hypothetical protein
MVDVVKSHSRSASLAREGIRTGEDFANLMSALMSDVLDGSVSPVVANATVNAGGKLLKVVQMQMAYRYGTPREQAASILILAPGAKADPEVPA